jgi:hypothetical protein
MVAPEIRIPKQDLVVLDLARDPETKTRRGWINSQDLGLTPQMEAHMVAARIMGETQVDLQSFSYCHGMARNEVNPFTTKVFREAIDDFFRVGRPDELKRQSQRGSLKFAALDGHRQTRIFTRFVHCDLGFASPAQSEQSHDPSQNWPN